MARKRSDAPGQVLLALDVAAAEAPDGGGDAAWWRGRRELLTRPETGDGLDAYEVGSACLVRLAWLAKRGQGEAFEAAQLRCLLRRTLARATDRQRSGLSALAAELAKRPERLRR